MRVLVVLATVLAAACAPPGPPKPPGESGSPPQSPPAAARRLALPEGTFVDLSHTYDQTTVFWPTAAPFRLEKVADGVTPGGYYYAANNFFTSEHGGTHLDAPVHFAQGAQSADRIPLDRFFGEAAVIDVTAQADANADYLVTVDDLLRAEREGGPIPTGAIVLIRTGFSTRWPDAARYLGTAERGEAAATKLHFPGLHPGAATWLLDNRQPKAVGIDTASIDHGPSSAFETHRALFARNVPAFENLTNLDALPLRGALVVALPMKIGGGSGGPLRAVAIVAP
jgi:kynurenine formamidase